MRNKGQENKIIILLYLVQERKRKKSWGKKNGKVFSSSLTFLLSCLSSYFSLRVFSCLIVYLIIFFPLLFKIKLLPQFTFLCKPNKGNKLCSLENHLVSLPFHKFQTHPRSRKGINARHVDTKPIPLFLLLPISVKPLQHFKSINEQLMLVNRFTSNLQL